MRKTVISAAALAMSTALVGFAYAATPGGPTATDTTSVVSPASTSAVSHDVSDAPDDSDGRVVSRPGADDPATHDAGSAGVVVRHAGDDPVGHDVGDDNGSAGQCADDPAGPDAGDDHGSGGHGSDD